VLRKAASALASTPARVAVAWVLATVPQSVPLVGIKREAQLRDVLAAVELALPAAWRARLDAASSAALADAEPHDAGA
jgi:aryl-alcohol dehydrogenase-like predicted oxidoreductase